MSSYRDFLVFDINWQSKFNYALDWYRPMAEVWSLMQIKNKQIEESKSKQKRGR